MLLRVLLTNGYHDVKKHNEDLELITNYDLVSAHMLY